MSRLLGAMKLNIREIVLKEQRPFSFVDFREFEVGGVQNLTTGDHLKDFTARVVVTNGQRLFTFENITVPDGDFSVKYIFPDDGTHQVIARINEKNSATLASFNVFVPHQPLPSILNPFPSSPGTTEDNGGLIASKVLAILLPAAAVISIIYVLKKGGKSKRNKRVKQ